MNTVHFAVSAAVVNVLAKDRLRTAEESRRAAEVRRGAAGGSHRPRLAWFHRSAATVGDA